MHRVAHGFSCCLSAALLAACHVALLTVAPAHAASIGVSPTLIDLNTGGSVAGLTVRNGDATQPINVQARIVRWQQDDTGDVYTPSEAVVASPPVTRIAPGAENLIRIVRTAKHPVVGEESYRLLVDELPTPGGQTASTISMLIRHSVPVFFSQPHATSAQAQWQIARVSPQVDARHGWRVTVENTGDKRLRLANLALYDSHGTLLGEQQGLVGYVLGRARMNFFVADVRANKPGALHNDTNAKASTLAAAALRLSVRTETGLLETGLLPVASP